MRRTIKNITGSILLLALVISGCKEDKQTEKRAKSNNGLNTLEDSINYVLGMGTSKYFDFFNENDYKPEVIRQGFLDALYKDEYLIQVDDQTGGISQRYFSKAQELKDDSLMRRSNAFLEKNGKREGVITTERGLQYETIKEGTPGGPKPNGYDFVFIDYKQGTPLEGILWDKTMATNPRDTIQLAINRELTGLSELCQHMTEGQKVKAWLPPSIGSAAGRDPVGVSVKNDIIYIELELFKFTPREREELGEGERNGFNSFFLDES